MSLKQNKLFVLAKFLLILRAKGKNIIIMQKFMRNHFSMKRVILFGCFMLFCAYGENTPQSLEQVPDSQNTTNATQKVAPELEVLTEKNCRGSLLGGFSCVDENNESNGDIFSQISNFTNILGFEYGVSNAEVEKGHFSFDVGLLSIGSIGKTHRQYFGAKFHYELGYGKDLKSIHHYGGEMFWHPSFLNFGGYQVLSAYVGYGARRGAGRNGTYLDGGVLVLPTSPVFLALTLRTDFLPNHTPTNSLMLSIRMPLGIFTTPFAIPLASGISTAHISAKRR
ncbi:hypothetical protein CQA49_05960 [Helicobacter sp. MIT 00-7814]|nr:hypothetical protein CQA49_05960 [Helicobacter sp. MIT 00-7814]RDU57074.1 hypothetical protein CQA37_01320 [Helicobacter sp. MIT 99-10781]